MPRHLDRPTQAPGVEIKSEIVFEIIVAEKILRGGQQLGQHSTTMVLALPFSEARNSSAAAAAAAAGQQREGLEGGERLKRLLLGGHVEVGPST